MKHIEEQIAGLRKWHKAPADSTAADTMQSLLDVVKAVKHIVDEDYDYVSYYMGSGDWHAVKAAVAKLKEGR